MNKRERGPEVPHPIRDGEFTAVEVQENFWAVYRCGRFIGSYRTTKAADLLRKAAEARAPRPAAEPFDWLV